MSAWPELGARLVSGRALGALSGAGVGPIGLDLAPDAMHLVQLCNGSSPRVSAAHSVAYPESREATLGSRDALRSLVRDALRAGGFRGRRVVSALPPGDVKVMILNYTLEPDQDEPPVILQRVEERTGDPVEELVVDYLPIRMVGEEGGDRSALVAVSRREVVIAHLEALRLGRLQVEALEIAPVAVRRLALFDASVASSNQIVIHCGSRSSHLSVLWGRRWALYREIEIGEAAIVSAVAKALDMQPDAAVGLLERYGVHPPGPGDPADSDLDATFEFSQTLMEIVKPTFYALAEQVNAALVYMASKFRGAAPDRLELSGALTRWPRSGRLLEGLVEVPVGVLEPSGLFASAGPAFESELAVATGLALRGMVGDG